MSNMTPFVVLFPTHHSGTILINKILFINLHIESLKQVMAELKKQSLSVAFSPSLFALLQKLAGQTGKSKSEILGAGLTLYGIVKEADKKGDKLAIVSDDGGIREILVTYENISIL